MASRGGYPMSAAPGGLRVPPSVQQSPAFRAVGPSSASPSPFQQRPGMSPSRAMPMGLGTIPGPSFGAGPPMRAGIPQSGMDPFRKRFLQQQQGLANQRKGLKRRKMADRILPQRIRELVPESQAYMDLLAFERKLDQTIARKRMEIQEAIKKPITQKRKLRIYISNTYTPGKAEGEEAEGISSWELRVEGKLLEDVSVEGWHLAGAHWHPARRSGHKSALFVCLFACLPQPGKQKRKFSSFFKSLVIELDKDLYGPDNHLVEWHRMPTTQETDGFQVKRPGDVNVKCTLLLMLDHQYKLDPRLARLLGVHTQTRASIMQALWLYIKTNKLQDGHEKEYINCNRYFRQIFSCTRMKFSEIPMKLASLLQHPDPIIINHMISVDPNDQKKTACYDIDVEVDDPLKGQMSGFLSSTTKDQEIAALEMKVCLGGGHRMPAPWHRVTSSLVPDPRDHRVHQPAEDSEGLHVELQREPPGVHPRLAQVSVSRPQGNWPLAWRGCATRGPLPSVTSVSFVWQLMTDITGNAEEERRTEFYEASWAQEAVGRYIFSKVREGDGWEGPVPTVGSRH
ncbi:SMRD2 regulator, partial [Polypterus senegalus]